ncbi:hypothetical protein Aglo03_05520 [Actinokineospora globicatena]|uniref:Uncharacterized protein n=1 Tax=Actinokineospora globicatena TaxID=103729 RepID=A0A9W6V887_9PSEU|nr:hypothetical protein [Actinokineospora globicatena]GLW89736.1 hypothetical protein Aglo03_05520 [Actinokineospora globicatena]
MAHADQLGDGPFRARGGVTQRRGEQGGGFRSGEHVDAEGSGAVTGDEAAQPRAAGDQDRARAAAREKRCDLVGGRRVVQQDQHPLAGGVCPEERRTRVDVRGMAFAVHPERGEELGQHVARAPGLSRAEAPQVHRELSVGEPVQVAVRPGQREPGLADAPEPGDHHGFGSLLPVRREIGRGVRAAVEVGQVVEAADEPVRRRVQLPGSGWPRRDSMVVHLEGVDAVHLHRVRHGRGDHCVARVGGGTHWPVFVAVLVSDHHRLPLMPWRA